jgi:uncharacterized protein
VLQRQHGDRVSKRRQRQLRLSRYTHVVPDGADVYLVGLLTRAVIKVVRVDYEAIEAMIVAGQSTLPKRAGLLQALRSALVLVPTDFDELEYLAQRNLMARAVSDVLAVVMIPSMRCNMGCHYCYEDKSDAGAMSPEVESQLIEYLTERLQSGYSTLYLRWFGGEPLMNTSMVETLSQSLGNVARKFGAAFDGDVVTNGYFLDKACARRLKAVGLKAAQITFEGPQRLHDRVRKPEAGEGSYDRLVRNTIAASEFLDIRLRVHVAPYNVERLPAMLDDLAARGVAAAAKSIYFAPLFNYRQTEPESAFRSRPRLYLSSNDFASAQSELIRHALARGFKANDPLDSDYGVCTALREHTVVVNSDGSLSKCYLDAGNAKEVFGTVTQPSLHPENLSKWRNAFFLDDEECRECSVAPVCLGGCTKQTLSGADKSLVCSPLRYNLSDMVRHYFGVARSG